MRLGRHGEFLLGCEPPQNRTCAINACGSPKHSPLIFLCVASPAAMGGGTTVSRPNLSRLGGCADFVDEAIATTHDESPGGPASAPVSRCHTQNTGITREAVGSVPAAKARVARGDGPASTVSSRHRISGRSSVSGFGRAENFPFVMFPSRAGTPESQTSPVCEVGISCEPRHAVQTGEGASSLRPPSERTAPNVAARPLRTIAHRIPLLFQR